MDNTFYSWYSTLLDAEDRAAMSGSKTLVPGPEMVGDEQPCPAPPGHSLLGTWRLRACIQIGVAGQVSTRYEHTGGRTPVYYIKYRENSTVCLVRTRANCPGVSPLDLIGVGNLLVEPVGAGDLHRAACGTYALRADTLGHRLDSGAFPAWFGLDGAYLVQPVGRMLAWRACRQEGPNQLVQTRLWWERA